MDWILIPVRERLSMIEASAPSNIALIKYMGKEADNIPANPSLSYSLPHLLTKVQLEISSESNDSWEAISGEEGVSLSTKGIERYLKFFAKLKHEFGIEGNYIVRSSNNFPSDCGLASSASSFAALTKAAYALAHRDFNESLKRRGFAGDEALDKEFLSSFSRQGSGSSCRSLFPEWAVWKKDHAYSTELPYTDLLHLAVISEEDKKEVSSSEAHKRVRSSLQMTGRTERAEIRLNKLESAFNNKDWNKAFEICWAEFWDMHSLFESSEPSFGYMNAGSLEILSQCKDFWKKNSDGPIVTMDAGPNVHLLFRKDQEAAYYEMKLKLSKKFKVWGNE